MRPGQRGLCPRLAEHLLRAASGADPRCPAGPRAPLWRRAVRPGRASGAEPGGRGGALQPRRSAPTPGRRQVPGTDPAPGPPALAWEPLGDLEAGLGSCCVALGSVNSAPRSPSGAMSRFSPRWGWKGPAALPQGPATVPLPGFSIPGKGTVFS